MTDWIFALACVDDRDFKGKVDLLPAIPGSLWVFGPVSENALLECRKQGVSLKQTPSCQSDDQALHEIFSTLGDTDSKLLFLGRGTTWGDFTLDQLEKHFNSDHMFRFLSPIRMENGFWPRTLQLDSKSPQASLDSLAGFFLVPFADPKCFAARTLDKSEFLSSQEFPFFSLIEQICQVGYRSCLVNVGSAKAPVETEMPTQFPPVLATEMERFGVSPRTEALRYIWRSRADAKNLIFDCSHLEPLHNGSFHHLRQMLAEFHRLMSQEKVTIVANQAALQFHGFFDEMPRFEYVFHLDQLDSTKRYDCGIRFGQPWAWIDTLALFRSARSCYWVILDTIGWDCFQNKNGFPSLDELWNFVATRADGFIYNSQFSKHQFLNRFPSAQSKSQLVTLLSTSATDYRSGPDCLAKSLELPEPFLLVIGNSFPHKATNATTRFLLDQGHHVVVIGSCQIQHPQLRVFQSGNLTSEVLDETYSRSQAVVYPSHYEGFGFPIVEALARNKQIYVRSSPQVAEIQAKLKGNGAIHSFTTFSGLRDSLAALNVGKPVQKGVSSDWNWQTSAKLFWDFLLQENPVQTDQEWIQTLYDIRTLDMAKRHILF